MVKDVDGVTSASLGRTILGMPAFRPCTPAGIMRLLEAHDIELDGAHGVVIGRSPILGRPMASMLINAHATVTLCHSRTRNLPDIVRQADVLIAASANRGSFRATGSRTGRWSSMPGTTRATSEMSTSTPCCPAPRTSRPCRVALGR